MVDGSRKEENMSGTMMMTVGVACIALGIIVFIASIIYQNTAGKKIKVELEKEYT